MLGPNDRIRLKVYGEPDITGEYEINSGGQVSIPLAGHIKAAGATTRQLERSIASALAKGIVRDPRVNVEIAQYRPYYILGEVKKSGEYPYRLGLTVMDAVASAGGFTYRANENKVFLRRSGAGAEETYRSRRSCSGFSGRQHSDSGTLLLASRTTYDDHAAATVRAMHDAVCRVAVTDLFAMQNILQREETFSREARCRRAHHFNLTTQ